MRRADRGRRRGVRGGGAGDLAVRPARAAIFGSIPAFPPRLLFWPADPKVALGGAWAAVGSRMGRRARRVRHCELEGAGGSGNAGKGARRPAHIQPLRSPHRLGPRCGHTLRHGRPRHLISPPPSLSPQSEGERGGGGWERGGGGGG